MTREIGALASRNRYVPPVETDQPEAGSATVTCSPLPAVSYTVTVAPETVGSPAPPGVGVTTRFRVGSRRVDDRKDSRRPPGLAGGSVSFSAEVRIVT